MPPRQLQSFNASAPHDTPTLLLGSQSPQPAQLENGNYQRANDFLSPDTAGLELGIGASYIRNDDINRLYPSNSFNVWSPSTDMGIEPDQAQFTSLASMHLDPTLSGDYRSFDASSNTQLRFPNGTQTSNYLNSWTHFTDQDYSLGSQNQSTLLPKQQHLKLQVRPLSVMGHPQGSLPRRRSKYLRASPEGTIVAAPIPIPGAISQPALNPMQRWQDSPPETEAASLSAIAGALKSALPLPESSDDPRSRAGLSRAASTTSLNSERTSHSSKSATSARSATSKDLFLPRLNTRGGISKVKRVNPKANNKERKTFQCTFCCDSFRSKYDWARHEKSLHLSLEGWVCTPEGGAVVSSDTGGTHCAYCNLPDPSPEHLETHQHSVCQSTGPPHIFNRKDHLVQHLRLVHQLDMIPVVNHWKVEAPPVRSRCGICDTEMNTWKERVDHIAQHFRKGKTMADWKGDHCFEPAIAARVTNAIPPYLIRDETISLVPFSATDAGTRDHFSQIHINHLQNTTVDRDKPKSMPPPTSSPDENPSTTFVDVLALGLARFARQNMILGVVPTDEMFQNESRRLVYGCEDAWDQTIADNAEWLSSFRLKNMKGRMENENK